MRHRCLAFALVQPGAVCEAACSVGAAARLQDVPETPCRPLRLTALTTICLSVRGHGAGRNIGRRALHETAQTP